MKELVRKIEDANEAACQSETKVIELLEKQTRLQEESVATEKEFLNVFKSVMNPINSK